MFIAVKNRTVSHNIIFEFVPELFSLDLDESFEALLSFLDRLGFSVIISLLLMNVGSLEVWRVGSIEDSVICMRVGELELNNDGLLVSSVMDGEDDTAAISRSPPPHTPLFLARNFSIKQYQ